MSEEGVPVFISVLIAAGIIGAFIFASIMILIFVMPAV
jgi:hypothetical protein